MERKWSIFRVSGTNVIDTKIKPSNPYNVDAKPSGTVTKITNKMDEATKRSLMRENEAAETIAKMDIILSKIQLLRELQEIQII